MGKEGNELGQFAQTCDIGFGWGWGWNSGGGWWGDEVIGGGGGGGGGGEGQTEEKTNKPCRPPTWDESIGPNGIFNQLLNPLGINQTWGGREFIYEQTVPSSFRELTTKIIENGWERFSTDPHYKHWGYNDFRTRYKGHWYHLSVKRPVFIDYEGGMIIDTPDRPPTGFSIHWEEAKPGSVLHFLNFLGSTLYGIPIKAFHPCTRKVIGHN